MEFRPFLILNNKMFGKLVGEISHKKPAVKSSQPRDTDVVKLIIEENWALK
jgi:hypothetical protein